MRKEARDATWNALTEGRWQDFGRGVAVLAKQNLEVAKSELWFAGMMAWGAVTTPIRIFTHDIPEFINAGKERKEGKDRFWDVLFTSTNLMGDVAGTYGMTKPVGLVGNANSWLSRNLLGRDLPTIAPRFLPYYFRDMLNGGVNRNLINNLVENTYSAPSQIFANFLKFQNTYQQPSTVTTTIDWKPGTPGRPSVVKQAVDPIESAWYRKLWGHPNSRYSPANTEDMVSRLFYGDLERYLNFVNTIDANIPQNTTVVMRGSAVNGYKWVNGRPFDGGNIPSDIDLILIGREPMKLWTNGKNVYLGNQTPFASSEVPKGISSAPSLYDLILELEKQSGRGVNFVGMSKVLYEFRNLAQGMPDITVLEK
jgi:hypothetical protein